LWASQYDRSKCRRPAAAIGAGPRELGALRRSWTPPRSTPPSWPHGSTSLKSRVNLASFCQSTTLDSNHNRLQPPPRDSLPCGLLSRATHISRESTRGLHIYDPRALGAHNVPISLIARGRVCRLVDAKIQMVCPIAALALSMKSSQKISTRAARTRNNSSSH
jgi:hypothetical protein